MKKLKIGAGVVVVLLIVLVVSAPIGPLPGFFIGGTQTEVPEVWPDTSGTHEIRLKVQGALPRVVNIWVVDYEGELYVVGSKDTGWVSMLGDSAPVEMRLEGNTYALTAMLLTEDWQSIGQAYVEKYQADYPDIVGGFPSLEEAASQIRVYHLNRNLFTHILGVY